MHSHFGLQEQLLGTAPLILQTEEQQDKADEQYVILLGDFSFKPPGQILTKLKAGMKKMKGMSGMTAMRNNRRTSGPEMGRCRACVLGGNMANYSWTINGAAYPNNNSLNVK